MGSFAVGQAVLEMAAAKSRKRALLDVVVAWGRVKAPDSVSGKHKQRGLFQFWRQLCRVG